MMTNISHTMDTFSQTIRDFTVDENYYRQVECRGSDNSRLIPVGRLKHAFGIAFAHKYDQTKSVIIMTSPEKSTVGLALSTAASRAIMLLRGWDPTVGDPATKKIPQRVG